MYLIFRYFKQDRKARRFNIFGHARTTKRVSNFRADRIRDNFVNSFRLNTRIHYIYIYTLNCIKSEDKDVYLHFTSSIIENVETLFTFHFIFHLFIPVLFDSLSSGIHEW